MGLIRRRKKNQPEPDRFGDDGFGDGDVRIIGPASSSADETGELVSDVELDGTPGGSVLDELSMAFDDVDDPEVDVLTSRVPVTGAHQRGAPATESIDVVSAGEPEPEPRSKRSKRKGAESSDDEPARDAATISIGGDDDLPDAVYLDEAIGLGGDGTVFIDDDGRGDAIMPQDATGPGIEPRLRQRRIGVRRAEGRRRLKWVAIIGVVLVLLIGVLAVLGSGLFSVDDVTVSGQRYADDAVVQEVIDDLVGTPTLLVDTAAAERRLEEIAWVESARVRTDFPSSASIELRERVPLATIRGADERYRILDREGRVLAIETGQPVAPVLISGPGTLDLEVGQFADVGYAAASTLVTKLTPEVRSRLVSISATPDGSDIRLILRNELINGDPAPDIEVRLGAAIGDNEQFERLVRLERVLDDIDGGGTTIIDVSTDEATER
ncbi:cell division protein FtsQ/DivIB [Ilumatobacter coccineus]|uniref:Putative cell division protein FtsQ n=1 Tax=Ilumatobacter coccineus (strain NBRC 103263 / KCTC 29153 / YM16-304) TaxID=1313172 RepID=A0A6C7E7A6_ILUCY|nr:FtsQ-type POTRA domain-containing protein [Ilumatobacter coccineus]BAN02263.1 putative cell division protein FtsQ [Ilumatobacter coccineus YM16-304]